MSSASVPAPPAVNHRGEAETAVRGAEALWRVPPSHFISPHPHLVKVPLSLCFTWYSLYNEHTNLTSYTYSFCRGHSWDLEELKALKQKDKKSLYSFALCVSLYQTDFLSFSFKAYSYIKPQLGFWQSVCKICVQVCVCYFHWWMWSFSSVPE